MREVHVWPLFPRRLHGIGGSNVSTNSNYLLPVAFSEQLKVTLMFTRFSFREYECLLHVNETPPFKRVLD
jgi:hypothetical protein